VISDDEMQRIHGWAIACYRFGQPLDHTIRCACGRVFKTLREMFECDEREHKEKAK
jgi:hypothetical protein